MIVFCLAFYVFFVNQAVFNVIKAEKMQNQISQLRSQVGSLESQYLKLKSGLTLSIAYKLGFSEVTSPQYVRSASLGKGLSLNNEI